MINHDVEFIELKSVYIKIKNFVKHKVKQKLLATENVLDLLIEFEFQFRDVMNRCVVGEWDVCPRGLMVNRG